jgi:hypothetical protein
MLPREEHFLLDLSCLLEGKQMEVKQLIGKLYPTVCVPEFMGDKPKQWDFMVTMTTVLLFRYVDIREYYGRRHGSPIVHAIVERAKHAWRLPEAAMADDRLDALSKKIQEGFMAKFEG